MHNYSYDHQLLELDSLLSYKNDVTDWEDDFDPEAEFEIEQDEETDDKDEEEKDEDDEDEYDDFEIEEDDEV